MGGRGKNSDRLQDGHREQNRVKKETENSTRGKKQV